MSRRVVWVVYCDEHWDIPDGLLGVFAKKSDAVAAAQDYMRDACEGLRYTRNEDRYPHGVAVHFFESSFPIAVRVIPKELQP